MIALYSDYDLAIGLWNNMITPAANKTRGMIPGSVPLCAQPDTLLYTY